MIYFCSYCDMRVLYKNISFSKFGSDAWKCKICGEKGTVISCNEIKNWEVYDDDGHLIPTSVPPFGLPSGMCDKCKDRFECFTNSLE